MNRDSKFRNEYKYTRRYGNPLHIWSSVGWNGVHIHITDHGESHTAKYGTRYSGGVEMHYRSPPEYMKGDAPSDDHCWLLGGPCWHDGSSVMASDVWIPFWLESPNDHDRMFQRMRGILMDEGA